MNELEILIQEYNKSPKIFQAGRYWKAYEEKIIKEIEKADINELRSGKYPIFATFGFQEVVYYYHPNRSRTFYKLLSEFLIKVTRKFYLKHKTSLPYSIRLSDIREMAYHHCILQGKLANIKSISEIEVSVFGNPNDLFEIKGKKYTMVFLNYYLRLCYAHKYLKFNGNEIIVELGSGSGHQVEVIKKVFPNITVLCFDLPYTLFLASKYLSKALGDEKLVKPSEAINIYNLNQIKKGKIYMFGNWQFPLLKNYRFDVFWNAASFGEMEPDIVNNYLSYIVENCEAVYLLQARQGQRSTGTSGVKTPITFNDYISMLNGFKLIKQSDAFLAHKRLSQCGGYFQAVWRKFSANL